MSLILESKNFDVELELLVVDNLELSMLADKREESEHVDNLELTDKP